MKNPFLPTTLVATLLLALSPVWLELLNGSPAPAATFPSATGELLAVSRRPAPPVAFDPARELRLPQIFTASATTRFNGPDLSAPEPALPPARVRMAGLTATHSRATGFRTDRHNNPTAMTTEVAAEGGLLEGRDYLRGDAFRGADGRRYYTARLLGDAIEITIRAIDTGGMYTQSGRPRWVYLDRIPKARRWSRLNYDQKMAIVMAMYRIEGGSGALGRVAPAETFAPPGPVAP